MPFEMKAGCPCCHKGELQAERLIKLKKGKPLTKRDKINLLIAYHHCPSCWSDFHQGARDKDYESEKTFIRNNMGWFDVKKVTKKILRKHG